MKMLSCFVLLCACAFLGTAQAQKRPENSVRTPKWWKGNLHTHTFWSDGDDYPDMVAEWYKKNGYHFLAISDHNIMLDGEKWVEVRTNKNAQLAFEKYRARFGPAVQTRTESGKTLVRLATLGELKRDFEEPERFLLIPSEEISARFEKLPVHVNATNLRDLIKPKGGNSVYEVIQNNIDAVLQQRERTGQPMIPHLNHPNFHYAVTTEDLMRVKGERFFEVYNGHPTVYNDGNDKHPSTERMWDIILAWRLGVLEMEPLYGIAVDDSHHYHDWQPKNSNSGRGWIMVQSRSLKPAAIIEAMEAGDFYATTGVRLKTVERSNDGLEVEIQPERGVEYTIDFIGTRTNFVAAAAGDGGPQTDPSRIGEVLKSFRGERKARYSLQGDELYVRAKITSSEVKTNSPVAGEMERAWTQPLIPEKHLHLPKR